jgi:23S rRNA (pseudouridine1915-N3)-methyltransferase
MRLLLVGVGRLRPALREVTDDYLRRLNRVVAIEEREAREAGQAATAALRQQQEDERILRLVPANAAITLLEVTGSPWSSEQLAVQLDSWRVAARDRALVIGGAEGVGPSVRGRADQRWSLGALTLPHELARLIVAEQLYRAAMILQGHPYHRGAE